MDGIDARLSAVEAGFVRLDDRLRAIESDVAVIKATMATKVWVLGGVVSAVVAVLAGVLGIAWWLAQQYLIPILHALPH